MVEIKVFESVCSVAFSEKISDGISSYEIFDRIGKGGIDIDMVSMEITAGDIMGVGFTVRDDDLSRLLPLIKSDKITTPVINCGNVKVVIKAEEMVGCPGVMAKVFSALDKVGCIPLLVTTGIDEISVLVRDSDGTDAGKALHAIFS